MFAINFYPAPLSILALYQLNPAMSLAVNVVVVVVAALGTAAVTFHPQRRAVNAEQHRSKS